MSFEDNSFNIVGCEVRYYGPHKHIAGRITGVVRVRIEECFMGNLSSYHLDLKVKADVGHVASNEVRTALLAHAAHQLNRLKSRHSYRPAIAAE
ncbi:MAG: hypothetical protein EOP50_14395 [Sphingobacteriales bacterium]|nr:MAG: hypothetical protein EOP50_14395 [Sphingobacteriales bacterium]